MALPWHTIYSLVSVPSKQAVLQVLGVKRLGGLRDTSELDRARVTRKEDLRGLLQRSSVQWDPCTV